jgi:cytochrome c biogenesis protein CcmG, thiol:disulfide interchange protein DsbE
MTPKRMLSALGAVGVAAVAGIGLAEGLGGGNTVTTPTTTIAPAQAQALLAGSPAPLAALHERASQLLAGGSAAFAAQLRLLHGYPLVINKWASWCVPCKAEFAAFQQASAHMGRAVAFVGVDSRDYSRQEALAFLRAVPVSYPSYYDPNGSLGEAITESSFTPVSVFYDRAGHRYIRDGAIPSAAKLEALIERYALDQPGA